MAKIIIEGESFDYLTLRQGKDGGVDVLGWTTYEKGSVLAGQARKVFLDAFDSEEQARAAYPQAKQFSNKWTDPQVSLSHLPSEDDFVPGGALPDDIED